MAAVSEGGGGRFEVGAGQWGGGVAEIKARVFGMRYWSILTQPRQDRGAC